MNTNDPGREPEPTDAELLRDFEAADVRLSNACENCMDFSEDGEPTDPEYLDAEHEWKLCSERREARGREYLSGARPMPKSWPITLADVLGHELPDTPAPDEKQCGATIMFIDGLERCVLPHGHGGWHNTAENRRGWSNDQDEVAQLRAEVARLKNELAAKSGGE